MRGPIPPASTDLDELAPDVSIEQIPLRVALTGRQLLELGVEVAVGDEKIEPAVVVVVEEGGAEAEQWPHDAVEAGTSRDIGEQPVTFVAIEGVYVFGEIGHEEIEITVVVVVAAVHPHAGLRSAIIRVGDPRSHADLDKVPVAVISVQLVGLGVVGHIDVQISVGIEISERDPKAGISSVGYPRLDAHIGESAVGIVPVQTVRLRGNPFRPVEHFQALVERLSAACGKCVEIELEIVGDVQVQQPVTVEIAEGGTGPPAIVPHAGLGGHVREGPSAVVAEQLVRPPVGQVDIGISVVVVVADGAAHAPGRRSETGFIRNFAEDAQPPVTVTGFVAEEAISRLCKRVSEGRAVDGEQVEPAVAVIVEKGGACGHRLEDVILTGAAGYVADGQPG